MCVSSRLQIFGCNGTTCGPTPTRKGSEKMRLLILASALVFATAAAAKPAPVDAPERAAGPADKIVCKRFTRTGTLSGSYRTCKTKREWERERDNVRQLNPTASCRSSVGGTC